MPKHWSLRSKLDFNFFLLLLFADKKVFKLDSEACSRNSCLGCNHNTCRQSKLTLAQLNVVIKIEKGST